MVKGSLSLAILRRRAFIKMEKKKKGDGTHPSCHFFRTCLIKSTNKVPVILRRGLSGDRQRRISRYLRVCTCFYLNIKLEPTYLLDIHTPVKLFCSLTKASFYTRSRRWPAMSCCHRNQEQMRSRNEGNGDRSSCQRARGKKSLIVALHSSK